MSGINQTSIYPGKKFILKFIAVFALMAGLSSCHTLTCPECGGDFVQPPPTQLQVEPFYHVELHNPTEVNINGELHNLQFFEAFNLQFKSSGGVCVMHAYIIKDYTDKQKYLEIKRAFKSGDMETVNSLLPDLQGWLVLTPDYNSVIKRIAESSDADVPPDPITFKCDDEDCITCWRDRRCIGESTFIDKLELRVMGGWRYDALPEVYYPGPRGGATYEKETIGFGRGGTDITLGLEASALFRIGALSSGRDNFHLGLLTGAWPVDGFLFVPVAAHARYTFNDVADWDKCECNAWYLFGNLGPAIPFGSGSPFLYCNEDCPEPNPLYFWGLGIGYDFWLSRCLDFSVDLGFRHAELPLPANEDCEECTGDLGKFPVRVSNQVFLRFGLTW